MKLHLGCGNIVLPGYIGIDRKNGQEVYPLAYDDNTADEIYASHILEHFSHREVEAVLRDWVRVLKPGGDLFIAVPDFEKISQLYLDGKELNIQGYIMGGHVDNDDYHKCLFDAEMLTELMQDAGLECVIPWQSETNDCAALPISLNLMGTKREKALRPVISPQKVGAAMSVPRLGFMDNFFCAFSALTPLNIGLRKHTGAFWGQCLERCMDEWIKEGKEWVLTIDYDTIFSQQNVIDLLTLAAAHPEADAIAPLQAHRTKATPLMTIEGADGNNLAELHRDFFAPELSRVTTAHFGLTLVKVSALQKMLKPWFWSRPGVDGWDDKRTDDDIYFWREWAKVGNTLFLANRVPVGHAELMIRWPDVNLSAIYQHPSEYYQDGEPAGVWK